MEQKIKDVLEDLRSALQADGGDLELISVTGTDVRVRLTGACGGCPHANQTLKEGIERILREKVSEDIVVTRVD